MFLVVGKASRCRLPWTPGIASVFTSVAGVDTITSPLVEFPQDLDGVSAYSSHEIEELDDIDSAFTTSHRNCSAFRSDQDSDGAPTTLTH